MHFGVNRANSDTSTNVGIGHLYGHYLPLHIDNNIDMFADDSTLYTSGHNVDEIQRSLQNNLNAVTTWCEDNRMVLNVAKTKCMLITTKQR